VTEAPSPPRALIEARLAVLDQVRDGLRRAMVVVFALAVLNLAVRRLAFDETHRLPLAILLVLTGAALFGIVLRAMLARARARHVDELQAMRSQDLIQESLEATTRP